MDCTHGRLGAIAGSALCWGGLFVLARQAWPRPFPGSFQRPLLFVPPLNAPTLILGPQGFEWLVVATILAGAALACWQMYWHRVAMAVRGEVRLDRAHCEQYSVSRLCRVLAVSRPVRVRLSSVRAQVNRALDAEVAAIYRASRGSYGRARIVRQLRAQGRPVSAKRVRRSLRRQGLRLVYKRPYRVTTDSTHRLPVAPNLLDRRFDD